MSMMYFILSVGEGGYGDCWTPSVYTPSWQLGDQYSLWLVSVIADISVQECSVSLSLFGIENLVDC